MKKEGDSIKPGDILASIEEGFVAKLLYPEGASNVKLGEVVAIIVEKKEDVQKFKDYKVEGSAPVAPVAAAPKKEAVVEKP